MRTAKEDFLFSTRYTREWEGDEWVDEKRGEREEAAMREKTLGTFKENLAERSRYKAAALIKVFSLSCQVLG